MAKFPTGGLNLDLRTLAGVQARGAVGGTTGNQYGGEPLIQSRNASGGATAGTAANPSRVGMAPISRQGAPSAVRSGAPPNVSFTAPPATSKVPGGKAQGAHMHALTMASLSHLKSMGHPHPHHEAIMGKAKAAHAAGKSQAMGPAKQPRGFGSLGGAMGGLQPSQPNFQATDGPSLIPGGRASATGAPPPDLP